METKAREDLILVKVMRILKQLWIGGVKVTSTASELNKLHGATITVDELNALDGAPLSATITVGEEATDVVNIAIQLQDANGDALAVRGSVMAYLSDDEFGNSIATTAPDGHVTVGTDGLLIPLITDKAFQLVSESDGDIDLDIEESGADTWYLVIVLPTGKLIVSDAITFAA